MAKLRQLLTRLLLVSAPAACCCSRPPAPGTRKPGQAQQPAIMPTP